MRLVQLLLAAGSALLVADVVPHCGGPEIVVRAPGEYCGHQGPRWRGDCRAPAACFDVRSQGPRCSMPCVSDTDCAPLGAGFRCTARGRSRFVEGDLDRSLCWPGDAAPPPPERPQKSPDGGGSRLGLLRLEWPGRG